ncbi:MAG: AAA family ATPase [Candidatus Mcinerneyibacterium aminivorans]|uniref:AAA family ATPase n=1 Tax=Candidatus Mcinerneyibacterium aminivorans TaxID=2703815 RepID=A0A5D0MJ66_9BACT|nr:MAG: AAA family ATPase [Candidatus Mcinerneyibacterium aminivorans]
MYNLEVLSATEFENLSKDLIENKTKKSFTTFKKGKDKGIDFIYDEDKKLVGQAKHYINSTFSDLKKSMKKEKKKMDLEKPDRYFLFTSLKLNPQQHEQIKQIMEPYVKSVSDIYNFDNIIELIKNNAEIEKKYYKLWLSSSNILKRIINNAQESTLEFYKEKILDNIKVYVKTDIFDKVLEKIKKKNFIIIYGEPGIGKTVISEMLIYHFLADFFSLKYISGNKIIEIESILSRDPQKKEIIFIDDFLGQNFLHYRNKNNQDKLVTFIDKYLDKNNKYVILTSRTNIYNKAKTRLEKLRNISYKLVDYSIEIQQYSKLEKAKILYNHIYHKSMNKEYLNELLNENFYLKIINHKNYNPRLIEFITETERFDKSSMKSYNKWIMDKLNNPQDIWGNEFFDNLNEYERIILLTILSFNKTSEYNKIENAFNKRLKYEINHNNISNKRNIFKISMRTLSDSFIKIKTISNKEKRYIDFLNPSIKDFLIHYLKNESQEQKSIIESLYYIDQMNIFMEEEEDILKINNDIIIDKLIGDIDEIYSENNKENKIIDILKSLDLYNDIINSDYIQLWNNIIQKYNINNIVTTSEIKFLIDYFKNHLNKTTLSLNINFLKNIDSLDRLELAKELIDLIYKDKFPFEYINKIEVLKSNIEDIYNKEINDSLINNIDYYLDEITYIPDEFRGRTNHNLEQRILEDIDENTDDFINDLNYIFNFDVDFESIDYMVKYFLENFPVYEEEYLQIIEDYRDDYIKESLAEDEYINQQIDEWKLNKHENTNAGETQNSSEIDRIKDMFDDLKCE